MDVPIVMMDNEFRDPDVERYLRFFDRYSPSIAVLGDAYNRRDAHQLNEVAETILDENPYKTVIVAPKHQDAFEILSDDVVLGYPNGYSEFKPSDYSDLSDWRGRDVHLLGGSPPTQYETIQELTQPTLTGEEPANITGVDWNGPQKISYLGEYFSRDGWKRADHLSIRETVRKSLEEIKAFWQEKDLWPETSPRDLHGPATVEPDEMIFMDQGGDPISRQEELEAAYVEEYQEKGKLAFQNESQKKFIEYRESLEPV